MNYTFWMPNGSPEYRYCRHTNRSKECSHHDVPEMVNRVARTFRGLPRRLQWVSPLVRWPDHCQWPSSIACSLGGAMEYTQKNVLREGKSLHPIMER